MDPSSILLKDGKNDFLQRNKENISPFILVMRSKVFSNSPLPSWYPRTPLQDITNVIDLFQVHEVEKDEMTKEYPQARSSCGFSPFHQKFLVKGKSMGVPKDASKGAATLRKGFR